MDDLVTYPVLRRVRHNGTEYAPNTDRDQLDLTPEEATPLIRLGYLGEATPPLTDLLQGLIDSGHDVENMNMKDTKKALGAYGANIKRAEVDAALATLKEDAS